MLNNDDLRSTDPDLDAYESRCADCGHPVEWCRCLDPHTHYLPAFPRLSVHHAQLAVCGVALTDPRQHATEPSCPDCKAWLDSTDSLEGL